MIKLLKKYFKCEYKEERKSEEWVKIDGTLNDVEKEAYLRQLGTIKNEIDYSEKKLKGLTEHIEGLKANFNYVKDHPERFKVRDRQFGSC